MSFIISISQSKGGSCKTTTAINLAGALIEKKYKTIVCDMDKDKPDAVEWSKQGVNMSHNDAIEFVEPLFEESPVAKIEELKEKYDFIILDTPPNYMQAAFKAILLSDIVVLPCSPSFLDQNNLETAIELPKMSGKPFYLLPSKIQKRHNLSQKLLDEISKTGFGLKNYITLKSKVMESAFYGQWIGKYAPNSESHIEFLELAAEVLFLAQSRA